jgi:glycosyltransferase involved in cell wall biosynthesis
MHTEQVKPYIKEFHSFVSIKDYPEKMASLNLDIAVAPLEDNWFNQCKSNLRLLEYGAMGWPVVCSDVFPYQSYEPPVIRCNNNVEEWVEAISDLIDDDSKRIKMGVDLNTWVNSKFDLEGWSSKWFNALVR